LVDDEVNQISALRVRKKKIIIFSPSTVVLKKMTSPKYENLILNIINKIDQPDFHYIFLPNSNRASSESMQNNDIRVNDRIRLYAEKQNIGTLLSRIIWIDWDINTEGIQKIIREADLVVTSRFHSMISALSLKIPLYVIGWGHKYLEILRLFNLDEFICDYSNADLERICKELLYLLDNKTRIQNQIQVNLPAVKESSNIQFKEIDVIFNE
jgi:colanic acid/amylovoran biosynthesis protein